MITTYLFDLARVLLFPKDTTYLGELNARYRELKDRPGFEFFDHFVLNDALLNYCRSIKNKKRLYVFTSGFIQNAPEIADILKSVFEDIYSAEQLGLSKKKPDSYITIARKMNVEPSQILFTDDNSENIEAAKQAGLSVFLYSDYEKLKKQFEEYLVD